MDNAFLSKFSVSAAKPITILGLCLLFLLRNSTISTFFCNSKDFNLKLSFFNLDLLLYTGLKSVTAAAHTAISTGRFFLTVDL